MNQDELLENLHRENDQRLSKLNTAINKVDAEMTLMIKVIGLCATSAPHRVDWKLGANFGDASCITTCPTCIAKRFLTNSLTENDLKLLKGEK